MSNQISSGRRIRLFNVIDDFTRQCHAITVDTSISGHRVVHAVDQIIDLHGKPEEKEEERDRDDDFEMEFDI